MTSALEFLEKMRGDPGPAEPLDEDDTPFVTDSYGSTLQRDRPSRDSFRPDNPEHRAIIEAEKEIRSLQLLGKMRGNTAVTPGSVGGRFQTEHGVATVRGLNLVKFNAMKRRSDVQLAQKNKEVDRQLPQEVSLSPMDKAHRPLGNEEQRVEALQERQRLVDEWLENAGIARVAIGGIEKYDRVVANTIRGFITESLASTFELEGMRLAARGLKTEPRDQADRMLDVEQNSPTYEDVGLGFNPVAGIQAGAQQVLPAGLGGSDVPFFERRLYMGVDAVNQLARVLDPTGFARWEAAIIESQLAPHKFTERFMSGEFDEGFQGAGYLSPWGAPGVLMGATVDVFADLTWGISKLLRPFAAARSQRALHTFAVAAEARGDVNGILRIAARGEAAVGNVDEAIKAAEKTRNVIVQPLTARQAGPALSKEVDALTKTQAKEVDRLRSSGFTVHVGEDGSFLSLGQDVTTKAVEPGTLLTETAKLMERDKVILAASRKAKADAMRVSPPGASTLEVGVSVTARKSTIEASAAVGRVNDSIRSVQGKIKRTSNSRGPNKAKRLEELKGQEKKLEAKRRQIVEDTTATEKVGADLAFKRGRFERDRATAMALGAQRSVSNSIGARQALVRNLQDATAVMATMGDDATKIITEDLETLHRVMIKGEDGVLVSPADAFSNTLVPSNAPRSFEVALEGARNAPTARVAQTQEMPFLGAMAGGNPMQRMGEMKIAMDRSIKLYSDVDSHLAFLGQTGIFDPAATAADVTASFAIHRMAKAYGAELMATAEPIKILEGLAAVRKDPVKARAALRRRFPDKVAAKNRAAQDRAMVFGTMATQKLADFNEAFLNVSRQTAEALAPETEIILMQALEAGEMIKDIRRRPLPNMTMPNELVNPSMQLLAEQRQMAFMIQGFKKAVKAGKIADETPGVLSPLATGEREALERMIPQLESALNDAVAMRSGVIESAMTKMFPPPSLEVGGRTIAYPRRAPLLEGTRPFLDPGAQWKNTGLHTEFNDRTRSMASAEHHWRSRYEELMPEGYIGDLDLEHAVSRAMEWDLEMGKAAGIPDELLKKAKKMERSKTPPSDPDVIALDNAFANVLGDMGKDAFHANRRVQEEIADFYRVAPENRRVAYFQHVWDRESELNKQSTRMTQRQALEEGFTPPEFLRSQRALDNHLASVGVEFKSGHMRRRSGALEDYKRDTTTSFEIYQRSMARAEFFGDAFEQAGNVLERSAARDALGANPHPGRLRLETLELVESRFHGIPSDGQAQMGLMYEAVQARLPGFMQRGILANPDGVNQVQRATYFATMNVYRSTLGFGMGTAMLNLTQNVLDSGQFGSMNMWKGVAKTWSKHDPVQLMLDGNLGDVAGGALAAGNKVDSFLRLMERDAPGTGRMMRLFDNMALGPQQWSENFNRGSSFFVSSSMLDGQGADFFDVVRGALNYSEQTHFLFGNFNRGTAFNGAFKPLVSPLTSYPIKMVSKLSNLAATNPTAFTRVMLQSGWASRVLYKAGFEEHDIGAFGLLPNRFWGDSGFSIGVGGRMIADWVTLSKIDETDPRYNRVKERAITSTMVYTGLPFRLMKDGFETTDIFSTNEVAASGEFTRRLFGADRPRQVVMENLSDVEAGIIAFGRVLGFAPLEKDMARRIAQQGYEIDALGAKQGRILSEAAQRRQVIDQFTPEELKDLEIYVAIHDLDPAQVRKRINDAAAELVNTTTRLRFLGVGGMARERMSEALAKELESLPHLEAQKRRERLGVRQEDITRGALREPLTPVPRTSQ